MTESAERLRQQRDQQTMSRAADRALLQPTSDDFGMDRQGERLRQALDRQQRMILALLKPLGLAYDDSRSARREGAQDTLAENCHPPNEPNKPFRINKSKQKRTQNEPTERRGPRL